MLIGGVLAVHVWTPGQRLTRTRGALASVPVRKQILCISPGAASWRGPAGCHRLFVTAAAGRRRCNGQRARRLVSAPQRMFSLHLAACTMVARAWWCLRTTTRPCSARRLHRGARPAVHRWLHRFSAGRAVAPWRPVSEPLAFPDWHTTRTHPATALASSCVAPVCACTLTRAVASAARG